MLRPYVERLADNLAMPQLEFKLDGTAEEALQQITDKSYALPFEMGSRRIIRVGVNFSSKTRNIEKWVVE